jgi:hypothetical protein
MKGPFALLLISGGIILIYGLFSGKIQFEKEALTPEGLKKAKNG